MFHYLVKEDEFLPAKEIDEEGLEALDSEIRRKILDEASGQKVSIKDLTDELDLEEQSAYYHVKKLRDSALLKTSGSRPRYLEAEKSAYYFRPSSVEPEENPVILGEVPEILEGFVENRKVRAYIVVGAPYPHGEYDRRHKSGFEASEIAFALGNYGKKRGKIVYKDTEIEEVEGPVISVGGPLVNTFSAEINDEMSARFGGNHNRILTPENTYSEDDVGLICREEIDGELRMMVAGLYGLGTSAAIKALSSRAGELGEKGAVVRGFGTKHDIEEIEVIEKL